MIGKNILEKVNLSELVLRWEASREGERNNEAVLNEKNNEAVLEGLHPNDNLKRFPSWICPGNHFYCQDLAFPKLEKDVSRQWSKESSEAIKARVDGILKSCHSSLGELALTGLEIWECLPDSLQLSTALYSLELANECFGKLSSLTSLSLINCTKLRGELRIRDCPKLRIHAERHKFSSRTLVFINGHQFGLVFSCGVSPYLQLLSSNYILLTFYVLAGMYMLHEIPITLCRVKKSKVRLKENQNSIIFYIYVTN